MTSAGTMQRWSSAAQPDHLAAEYPNFLRDGDDFAKFIRAAASTLDATAFLIVRLDPCHQTDAASVDKALDALHREGVSSRLCLAGHHSVLQRIDAAGIDCDHVGLMLDEVDVETPPSQLIWERIEAVRFHSGFVAAAARNLRLGCALDSMLVLAKDLGLCTLGSNALPGGGVLADHPGFDYMPSPLAASSPSRLTLPARPGSPVKAIHRVSSSR